MPTGLCADQSVGVVTMGGEKVERDLRLFASVPMTL